MTQRSGPEAHTLQPVHAMPDETPRRKDAHLDLCSTEEVEPHQNDTLFDEVHLLHEPLPEVAESEVDLSTSFLGKRLAAPIVITGMTGGTLRAGEVNRALAALAEELSLAFGVGSQRAMVEDFSAAASYQVRTVAPRVALLGNVGLWQAQRLGVSGAKRLMDAIGADGLAVHLNAGQEMVQPEGDRDFRGGLSAIASLASALGDRLVVKETGCGIGPATARRLIDVGVRTLDVSGLGGTSWVRVEALRSSGLRRALGMSFSGWGIPTAACVASVARASAGRAMIIASGGIRDGLMAAKALSLGAGLVGVALPVFRAFQRDGLSGAKEAIQEIIAGLKLAMVLTSSRTIEELRARPAVLTGEMKEWLSALSP
jgi:isopentenyl-diphosphate delta-isomerase